MLPKQNHRSHPNVKNSTIIIMVSSIILKLYTFFIEHLLPLLNNHLPAWTTRIRTADEEMGETTHPYTTPPPSQPPSSPQTRRQNRHPPPPPQLPTPSPRIPAWPEVEVEVEVEVPSIHLTHPSSSSDESTTRQDLRTRRASNARRRINTPLNPTQTTSRQLSLTAAEQRRVDAFCSSLPASPVPKEPPKEPPSLIQGSVTHRVPKHRQPEVLLDSMGVLFRDASEREVRGPRRTPKRHRKREPEQDPQYLMAPPRSSTRKARSGSTGYRVRVKRASLSSSVGSSTASLASPACCPRGVSYRSFSGFDLGVRRASLSSDADVEVDVDANRGGPHDARVRPSDPDLLEGRAETESDDDTGGGGRFGLWRMGRRGAGGGWKDWLRDMGLEGFDVP